MGRFHSSRKFRKAIRQGPYSRFSRVRAVSIQKPSHIRLTTVLPIRSNAFESKVLTRDPLTPEAEVVYKPLEALIDQSSAELPGLDIISFTPFLSPFRQRAALSSCLTRRLQGRAYDCQDEFDRP